LHTLSLKLKGGSESVVLEDTRQTIAGDGRGPHRTTGVACRNCDGSEGADHEQGHQERDHSADRPQCEGKARTEGKARSGRTTWISRRTRPQGSQGPQGPPISFTNAYSGQVTVANGSFAFADAICPTGKQVVGGGYATENVGTALLVPTNSYPIGTGDGRSAWYVVMFNIGNQPEAFWAVAYCVNN